MEYVRLGRAGVKISRLGLGTWLNFGPDPAADRAVVDAAIEVGLNFFDTADTDARGAAEESLGAALARHRREELVIATKVWGRVAEGPNRAGLSRKHIRQQCEASLRRLRVETIDLYQCQRLDPEVTLEEIVWTMDDLVRAGKIHYWGVGGWETGQLENALRLADSQHLVGPVSVQVRYNLLDREAERETLPALRRQGLAALAYSPLAQGVLTAKYLHALVPPAASRLADERLGGNLRQRYGDWTSCDLVRTLSEQALLNDVSPAAFALAWTLREDGATAAIMGCRTPDQVRQNVAALDVVLDDEAVRQVEAWG